MRNIIITTLGLLAAAPAMAQQSKDKVREEVIIKKKGDEAGKTTIVIDGDRITVNGKPLAEYDGNNIIIHKREMNDLAERSMREGQFELERAQHEMDRAMFEMRRSLPRAYEFRMGPENFNFEFNEDMAQGRGEPVAYLGVGLEKAEKGVKIREVSDGSAADKAGLKENDVITRFAGTAVNSPEQLTEAVRSKKPNEEVEISYIKAGEKKERKLKLKLGEMKRNVVVYRNGASPQAPPPPRTPRAPRAPLSPMDDMEGFSPMDPIAPIPPMPPMEGMNWSYGGRPQLGLRIQDTEEGKGVKVLDVNEGSLAASAGVKENDMLTEIDGRAVRNTDEAREAIMSVKDKNEYRIQLIRNGSPVTVTVKVPKKLKKTEL